MALVLFFKVFLLIAIVNCNNINMRWRRGWCTPHNCSSLNRPYRKNIIAITDFWCTSPLPDEYRSSSSSTGHFYILLVPKCQPVYLFHCIFSPFPTCIHPSADLLTCQINTGPSSSIVHFCTPQVQICLLLLPVLPIIFIIQPNSFLVYSFLLVYN